MSEGCAASPGWARARAGAARRRCCWSGRGARRSRRAPPACRRRPPRCRARRASPPPPRTPRGTTAWNTGITGRIRTGLAPSLPQRLAARRCRTTRSASCPRSRPPPRCPPRSPASPSSAPATPACPPSPSWRCTRPRGGARRNPPRTTSGRIITVFSSSHPLRQLYTNLL